MKKKILFIALHYPPSEGIADIRATNIASQLSKNNFDITVLTLNKDYYKKINKVIPKEIENINTIRIDYFMRLDAGNVLGNTRAPRIIRKLLMKMLPYFGLDYLFFWQRNAIKEVLKRNDKYDFIIATGPPFSNFLLAKRLSKRLKTKYIIDYRDPWSLTAHGSTSSKNILNRKLEQEILNDASLVVFNTPIMQNMMLDKFVVNNSLTLTNGFNKNTFISIQKIKFNKFTISYVGNFYIPKRIIDPLFNAFKILKEEYYEIYCSLSFVYCGISGEYIQNKAIEYDVNEILENRNLVQREEAFSITKSSNLSLIITTVEEKSTLSEKSIIPGKLFEALGMNTKVLCIAPNFSDVRKIISKENSGKAFQGNETRKIANYILEEYNSQKIENIKKADNSKYEWSNLINNLKIELDRL